jgi:hypothetical protein
MPRHIWVNPKRLKSAVATETVDGMRLTVGISPYSLPLFVVGRYDSKTGRFVIEFQYINDEKASPRPRVINGIEIHEGRLSRKILSISLPIDRHPLDRVAIIDLRTKIMDAFRERARGATDPITPDTPDTMNQNVAEELLDEANLKELAGDLVAS